MNRGKTIKPVSIIACHFKSSDSLNNIKKWEHLQHIQSLSQSIIIVYSIDSCLIDNQVEIDNLFKERLDQSTITIIYDKENNGLDLSKWLIGLSTIKVEFNLFDWIWLTNDSWFSNRSLSDFFEYYAGRFDLGLIGLTSSLEQKYHIQSYSWLLNGSNIVHFLNWNQYCNLDYQGVIERNEIGFCQNLLSRSIKIDCYFNTIPFCRLNLFSNFKIFEKLVREIKFPINKWRFIQSK